MSNFAKAVSCVLVVLCVIWFALYTMPAETDNCTPSLIARYTNVVISFQECTHQGLQCTIIPRDVERFHDNQTQLRECVAKIAGVKAEDDSL